MGWFRSSKPATPPTLNDPGYDQPNIGGPPLNSVELLSAGLIARNIVPPTYVSIQRREPNYEGPNFVMAPDDNGMQFYDRGGSWQEAPDPIRQSDFYADGNKVHPWARYQVALGLAIGSREAVMDNRFQVGKLIGYYHRPMYAGGQLPSIPRVNIQETEPITYGSQYVVPAAQAPQGVILANGLYVSSPDPY